MKSALLIDSVCFACGVVDSSIENDVVELVQAFEKEIRADQDKITRHACAESVDGVTPFAIYNDAVGISKAEAHDAIMNTASIKED